MLLDSFNNKTTEKINNNYIYHLIFDFNNPN